MTAGSAGTFPSHICARCDVAVATPFCAACGCDAGGARLPLQRASTEAAALMRRVNVGAGGAPGLWTFAHGAPVLGVLYWLFWLPLPPVSLGITIYLFFNGNRVALQRRRYRDAEQFRAVEGAWAVAGVIIFVPTLVATLIWAFTIVSFLVALGAAR